MAYRLIMFCLNIRIDMTYHYLKSILVKYKINNTELTELEYLKYRYKRYKYSLDINKVDKMFDKQQQQREYVYDLNTQCELEPTLSNLVFLILNIIKYYLIYKI